MENTVYAFHVDDYDLNSIESSIPDFLFTKIKKNHKVVLKPNWVAATHQDKKDDWEYIITHPQIISAVIIKVLERLGESGQIIILDSPETASSFEEILSHYPVDDWQAMCAARGVEFSIIDLRDDEWVTSGHAIIKRKKKDGDPHGKSEMNLTCDLSCFYGKKKSIKGYYGADYNISETNKAHDGENNIYSVSKTVLEADVFINIPKLKTHKKAGMTCCLKNLVGINTYKNYLPHYSIGGPADGGDQFPQNSVKNKSETTIMAFLKQQLLRYPFWAKLLSPLISFSPKVYGASEAVIRSGNWHGNDTIWRMILDLNKILIFGSPNHFMKDDKPENRKVYIGIVDAILCGEGNGPKAPSPRHLGYIISGYNPAAIDAVCAKMMGFDPLKIPSIRESFFIKKYKIAYFDIGDILIWFNNTTTKFCQMPSQLIQKFKPHFGWEGNIELDDHKTK